MTTILYWTIYWKIEAATILRYCLPGELLTGYQYRFSFGISLDLVSSILPLVKLCEHLKTFDWWKYLEDFRKLGHSTKKLFVNISRWDNCVKVFKNRKGTHLSQKGVTVVENWNKKTQDCLVENRGSLDILNFLVCWSIEFFEFLSAKKNKRRTKQRRIKR